jgi:ribosome biogenesis GTPase
MPDLAAHLGHCKFHNCSHLHEPHCPVRDAASADPPLISPIRYSIYADLHDELTQANRTW